MSSDWTSTYKRTISEFRTFLQSLPFFLRIPVKLFAFGIAAWGQILISLAQIVRFSLRVFLGGAVARTASLTSVWVTHARFVGTLHKICDDSLAVELLPWISKVSVIVRALLSIATDKPHFLLPLDVNISGRCNRGDEALLNLAPDVTQVVILGAGNDTRLHRLTGLPDGLFEVDAPSTQAYKLKRLGRHSNASVRFVPADFERESWLANLEAAGFDRTKKALIIWEGVTYYLTEAALRATLHSMSQCAPGTKLVLDYAVMERQLFGAEFGLWLFGKLGEPFHSLFTNESLLTLLAEYRLVPDAAAIPAREATRSRFGSEEAYQAVAAELKNHPHTVIDIKLISFTLQ